MADDGKRIALLAAGGTGGHLFPAQALATELLRRGWEVHLATDERAERFAGQFRAERMHVVRSATPGGRNPVKWMRALIDLIAGYGQSRRLISRLHPDVVVGFGGYPTLPPLFAAQQAGIPNMIHESNAVMGRANRVLARRASAVAVGFGEPNGKTVLTGNPVRADVMEAADRAYPARGRDDPFHLLIFGGSQGAQFFGEVLPAAIRSLDDGMRKLLRVVHQVREEQMAEAEGIYRQIEVDAVIAPFFADMPSRISEAHFVISRAGASTVSELAVIGRPALLVPYPHALDHDQAKNAEALANAGGAILFPQAELGVKKIAEILKNSIEDPERLAKMAEKAKRGARIDATSRLADLVEHLAAGSAT